MVFQSQLFRADSSAGHQAVTRSRREDGLCLLVGVILLSWCVLPWASHETYVAWCENPIQLWLYGIPLAKAPWYLHVDYHFHFFTTLALGFWLSWARRLWMRSLAWWMPFVALAIVSTMDECFQLGSRTRIAEWQDLAHDLAGISLCAWIHALAERRRRE
jgi:hypothetical protein